MITLKGRVTFQDFERNYSTVRSAAVAAVYDRAFNNFYPKEIWENGTKIWDRAEDKNLALLEELAGVRLDDL